MLTGTERSQALKKALRRADIQVIFATAAYLFMGYKTSVYIFLFVSPLYAALIARPVINLLSDSRHSMRRAVWRKANGRYFAFRDQRVLVVDDESHCRWLRVADIRQIYPALINDAQLRRAYPLTSQMLGEGSLQLYVRDDTLAAHLRRINDPSALRLGSWVQRSIAYPAGEVRRRLGIHLENETGT